MSDVLLRVVQHWGHSNHKHCRGQSCNLGDIPIHLFPGIHFTTSTLLKIKIIWHHLTSFNFLISDPFIYWFKYTNLWAPTKVIFHILHWDISQCQQWPGQIYQTETGWTCRAIWWPRLRCVRSGSRQAERPHRSPCWFDDIVPHCVSRFLVFSFLLLLFSFSGTKSSYSASSTLSMLKSAGNVPIGSASCDSWVGSELWGLLYRYIPVVLPSWSIHGCILGYPQQNYLKLTSWKSTLPECLWWAPQEDSFVEHLLGAKQFAGCFVCFSEVKPPHNKLSQSHAMCVLEPAVSSSRKFDFVGSMCL